MPDAVYSGRVGLQAAHHSGAGPGGPGRRSSAVAVGGDGGAFSSEGRFRGSGLPPILQVHDFAFMFLSEEDAYAEGGTALAEAWLRAADAGGCSSGGGTASEPSIPERGGPCSRTILLRFCGMWRSWWGR